jgi:hypothetical protein
MIDGFDSRNREPLLGAPRPGLSSPQALSSFNSHMIPRNHHQSTPGGAIWGGLSDGSADLPLPSRFLRASTSRHMIPGNQSYSIPVSHNDRSPPELPIDVPSISDSDETKPDVTRVDSYLSSSSELIPTQPAQSPGTFLPTASYQAIDNPVVRNSLPNLINMSTKYAGQDPVDYTLFEVDSAEACGTKLRKLRDLLASGHSLAAQQGLLEGMPYRYTPDTWAIEGMRPAERKAWCWWAKKEAEISGSGAKELPPLDPITDRYPVPVTSSGKKSSVVEKTSALELMYGYPPGALDAENTAFFLRPENAAYVPLLTAAHRIVKARQHCASPAGQGVLYVDPRLTIEIDTLLHFKRTLDGLVSTWGICTGVDANDVEHFSTEITSRVSTLRQAQMPPRQKQLVRTQMTSLNRPAWDM